MKRDDWEARVDRNDYEVNESSFLQITLENFGENFGKYVEQRIFKKKKKRINFFQNSLLQITN